MGSRKSSRYGSSTSQNKRHDAKTLEHVSPAPPRLPSITPKLHLPVTTLLPQQLFVIHGFLHPSEAKAIVASLEAIGLEPTPPPPPSQVSEFAVRRMKRAAFDSAEYCDALWTRTGMREILESTDFGVGDGWELAGLNPNMRCYRYDPGDRFGRHFDGFIELPADSEGRPRRTEYTLLIYLGDEQLEGGETVFWLPDAAGSAPRRKVSSKSSAKDRGRRSKRGEDALGTDVPVDGMEPLSVSATRGSMLLHRHGDACLLHEGAEVTKSCKYVLRTDLVFRGP